MAKALPRWLTRRRAAHMIIAKLALVAIRYQGWKDTRAANKARQRYPNNDS